MLGPSMATTDQLAGTTPSDPLCVIVKPLTSHSASVLVKASRHSTSAQQPPTFDTPTMDQLVPTAAIAPDCATCRPFISHSAAVPVVLSRQSRSTLPSVLKSR